MHDNQSLSAPDRCDHAGVPADDPIGEIRLGEPPAVGRRARLLAGLVTGTAAAAVIIASTPETGTSHSGPFG